MIAMQYKIFFTDDFDMDVIRNRVNIHGRKTDGFKDLFFKAYLISEKNDNGSRNSYCPLYVWKNHPGMNKFIFDGFYNNILDSFGWQNINIGIPFRYEFHENFQHSQYVIELENDIYPKQKMEPLDFTYDSDQSTGKILIYNPDKWKYTEYHFFKTLPGNRTQGKLYKVLHISL